MSKYLDTSEVDKATNKPYPRINVQNVLLVIRRVI